MIKINIEAEHSIENFLVEDLYKKEFQVNVGDVFSVNSDWFLIKIPYQGFKNEITSIKINNHDIGYLIYTGWFENRKKEKFQPATAVWEPGEFKIWMHKNFGLHQYYTYSQISNGDYGKNLFDDYMLTVDYSVDVDCSYPEDIRNFFKHPFGPRWWKKDDITRPYKILDNENFSFLNKTNLISDVLDVAKVKNINSSQTPNWWGWGLKKNSDLPLIDINTFSGELKKLIDLIGYTSIVDISIQYLNPKSVIKIHVDDHLKRDCWPYIAGCKKLYWNLTDTDSVYFKLGEAGMLPLDFPLLVNTSMHTHGLINDSNNVRTVVIIYGELDDNSTFKNLNFKK